MKMLDVWLNKENKKQQPQKWLWLQCLQRSTDNVRNSPKAIPNKMERESYKT